MIQELRLLWRPWLGSLLLPLPAILFWHSESGRRLAIWLFFVGCASLAAYAFRDITQGQLDGKLERTVRDWRLRITNVSIALLSAAFTFSLLLITFNDAHDWIAVFLACSLLIPCVCFTPCLVLLTRQLVAAVVFTLTLVGMMKLLGCVVVVCIYGWHADGMGYTTMPWTRPNLLVWLFWLNTGVLSLVLYANGKRQFLRGETKRASLVRT